VPHRHFVFSVPKILLRYLLYDRSLRSELSRCAWETLKEFFQEAFPEKDAVPRAIIAIHSFGDFLGWHLNLHILCMDGCFSDLATSPFPCECPGIGSVAFIMECSPLFASPRDVYRLNFLRRKLRIRSAILSPSSSSAKWPVSSR
jgi:hypothetical protein